MRRAAYLRTKRALDLAVAAPVLVASLPLQAVVAVTVAWRLGRPVLFRQLRPGLHGRPFELVKFRSMRTPDPTRGLVDDESRLTPFGRALRATSLDELPTLWNVVRGDMSLVGPRPLLMEYLPRYSAEQARRHDMRPGITGLAQVSGRNLVNWPERLSLDVEYVDRCSLALDVRILLVTIVSVLRRHGISPLGAATMPKFMGQPIVPGVPAR